MPEMPKTADVVIVGGGAVGASIAYNLARRGQRNVLLIERDQLGSGSTSKAAGGIRVQFPLPVEVRFSLFSLSLFHHFEEELGRDVDFRPAGYLFLITDPDSLGFYRSLLEMQRAEGADVRWLTPDDIRELVPALMTDDVLAATYCPDEGYAGPNEVVQAYAARAREMGVAIREDVAVTGIDVEAGRIRGVRTTAGDVATSVLVNAAGPWARPLAAMAGVDVPVFPRRRHIFVTDPFPAVGHPLPMIIDRGSGFYCRSEMQSVLMSPGDIGPETEFEVPPVDWSMMEVAVDRAVRRLPVLESAAIRSAWVGLRPLTPDEHAIVDFAPGVEGLVLAAGFCGHGFQHSPAAGKVVSELVLDGRASIDISPLSADRFGSQRELRPATVGEAD
jgi:sarcosine oxidase, subunit beta